MQENSKDYVWTYNKCQRFRPVPKHPPKLMTNVSTPLPFIKWGMEIIGKIPTAPGQRIYMLMLIDYFTKWVEAKIFHQVRQPKVKNFIWKNIICRFGVRYKIVMNNGS